jgi:hydrogenase maturation protease
MHKKIAIIGSGNPLFKDEGIGWYLAKYIHNNYSFSSPIEFVDGSTLGLNLQSYIQEYEKLIIINTNSDTSLKVGTVTIKDVHSLLEEQSNKQTANEVVISEMIQVCMLAGDIAEIEFISITPEDLISVDIGLSQSLLDAWDDLLQTVLQKIQDLDIGVTKLSHNEVKELYDISTFN